MESINVKKRFNLGDGFATYEFILIHEALAIAKQESISIFQDLAHNDII